MNEDHFAACLNTTVGFVSADISVQLKLVWSAHIRTLALKKNKVTLITIFNQTYSMWQTWLKTNSNLFMFIYILYFFSLCSKEVAIMLGKKADAGGG